MQIKSLLLAGAAVLMLAGTSWALAADDAGPLKPLFTPDQAEARAALLIEDGRVIAKHYAPGYSDANRFISWSMAKTITAMLVGELVTDGKLQLDAPAPIAEWQKPGDPRGKITLRQLLNMASGLDHTEVGEPVEKSDTNQVLFVTGTQGMAARAIGQPLEAKPGEKFEYSSLTTIILSEIITRTLTDSRDPRVRAKAYRDFEYARLFTPIGVTTAFPEFDGAGTQIGGSLIHMSLDDFGRIGGLLLDGKAPDGTQVIAPDWLAFMKSPSPTNAEYGGQTWLNLPGGADGTPSLFPDKGPANLVSMNGHLGQYVMAFDGNGTDAKVHHYVLVRLGKTQDTKLRGVIDRIGDVVNGLIKPMAG
ncbi:serine hydrolase [Sphingomonas sp. 28-63-12]|uniref:serine hydrolase domain-containing protein n=1 Tax=Sphingomonas sp. 28-63-12 TaxID=1970434 RepID=UPI000BD7A79D|nr:MAG: hypothetical protein B7Y47_10280 [Sphingomonas sp. 28-63-12]